MKNSDELLIYKDLKHEKLFENFVKLMMEENQKEEVIKEYYNTVHHIIEIGVRHGFRGNYWHCFMTYLLVNNENAYSIYCERKPFAKNMMYDLAKHDFQIFYDYFHYDIKKIDMQLKTDTMSYLENIQFEGQKSHIFNHRIAECINTLAKDLGKSQSVEEFAMLVSGFYESFGVGKIGLHKAFRVEHRENCKASIEPIGNIAHVKLDDLVGYELQKAKLIQNTQAFVDGKKANNCLLYGDAGTGKSSSIKAIINQYYDQGLRMIEVYKHQFKDLNDIIGEIKNRNYKFIIYMDDLSFEEFEIEYKFLKAVIEGGLEKKPDNVLIYATSNRRHLIRENFSDKEEVREDMHTSDTVSEKLSLSARFGVTIYYGSPSKKEFQSIVENLALKYHIDMDIEQLYMEANSWELSHGGLSGRTAQQFIDYLLGK